MKKLILEKRKHDSSISQLGVKGKFVTIPNYEAYQNLLTFKVNNFVITIPNIHLRAFLVENMRCKCGYPVRTKSDDKNYHTHIRHMFEETKIFYQSLAL